MPSIPQAYVRSNPWPFYLSWGLSFGLLLFISCSERLRRRYALLLLWCIAGNACPSATCRTSRPTCHCRWPINMVLLTLFTLFQAFLVGQVHQLLLHSSLSGLSPPCTTCPQ